MTNGIKKPRSYSDLLELLSQKDANAVGYTIASASISIMTANRQIYLDDKLAKHYQRKEEAKIFESLAILSRERDGRPLDYSNLQQSFEYAGEIASNQIVRIDFVCDAVMFMRNNLTEDNNMATMFKNLNDSLVATSKGELSSRMLEYKDYVKKLEKRLSKQYQVIFQ
jgi:hypothetical protein